MSRRNRPRDPSRDQDDRAALGLAFDLGAKPISTEQLDPALALATAEQTAINDAASGVYDTAGLLGASTPLLFDDQTAAQIRAEQAQAALRGLSASLASHAVATAIEVGRDDGAIQPGVGLLALERWYATALADEEHAEALVDRAEETLVRRGGEVPARHDRRTLVRLEAAKWGLSVVAVLLEFVLLRQALLIATRTEDPAEPAAMAGAVLVATVVLPHFAAWAIKAIRHQNGGWTLRVLLAVMAVVWLALIMWTADLRDIAAHTGAPEAPGGGVQVQTETGGLGLDVGGSDATDAVDGADAVDTVPGLAPGFALMMVGISLAILALGLKHTDEEIAWVRVRRALDVRRAEASTATSHLQDVHKRLEFQALDARAGDDAIEAYATVVLPRLGALITEQYRGELCRRVADAGFADALRALPRRFPVVVPESAAPEADAAAHAEADRDAEGAADAGAEPAPSAAGAR